MTLHIQPALMAKYHQAREAKVFAEKALSLAEEAFSDTEAELLRELGTVIELTPDELPPGLELGIDQSRHETNWQYIFVSDQLDVFWKQVVGRLYRDGRIVIDEIGKEKACTGVEPMQARNNVSQPMEASHNG